MINNYCGILTNNSTDIIQFNRITNNTYGLINEIGTVNATDNWWGSNNDPSTIQNDIDNINGTVNSNPWLILSVNASPTNSGGNTSVTADLTHNSDGVDILSQGFIPDGTPVNFTTNYGTIINQAYTLEGQATTILNLNTTQPENVTVSASVDNQTINITGLISKGVAVLNVTSTAIDNSTGQPLNIIYNIPLNNNVTWIGIVWSPTNIPGVSAPTDELQVIIDGNIVLENYIYNCDGTGNDVLTVTISYPGLPGLDLNVTDPDTDDVTNLDFPGNNISRSSEIIYQGTPFEGVESFAIATTDVTQDIYDYWLNQSSIYTNMTAGIGAAYESFLTALMVENVHDELADNISGVCNVTWSRTSPIIVSVCEDPYEVYLTLDCDEGMGMTVVGTPDNIRLFNFITSYSISPMEYTIMNSLYDVNYQSYSLDGEFGSVTMDLLNDYLSNSSTVEGFFDDGYIIIKSVYDDGDFLVIDPETGIVHDINTVNDFCGVGLPWAYPIMELTMGWYEFNPWVSSYTFYWNGTGQVYITNGGWLGTGWPDMNPSGVIWIAGELTVSSENGESLSFNQNPPDTGWLPGMVAVPDPDITSILTPGQWNTITLILNYPYSWLTDSYALWLITTSNPQLPYYPIGNDTDHHTPEFPPLFPIPTNATSTSTSGHQPNSFSPYSIFPGPEITVVHIIGQIAGEIPYDAQQFSKDCNSFANTYGGGGYSGSDTGTESGGTPPGEGY
ncbi:MAG: hypothetical protein ABSE83_11785 [Methanobacterium sp.]